MYIDVSDLQVRYPGRDQAAVDHVSFGLHQGQMGVLIGPSGCGKTTLLRAVAGLEPVNGGVISMNGQIIGSTAVHRPAENRRIGMVFQDYALFPHLSVEKNIGFGINHWDRTKRDARVKDLLSLVGLSSVPKHYPHELSGGQQQRVALARALAPKPDLLLLDEPFSNLDVDLRERLAGEVRDILKANGTTALLVTHDQFEAFAIADDVGVMVDGLLVQWDSAYNLYHRPATRFVADFVGYGVFVPGVTKPGPSVEIELGLLPLPQSSYGLPNEEVDVLLRADDIVHDDDSPLQAEVITKAFRGGDFLYTVALNSGQQLLTMVPSHHNHAIGEKIGIKLVADHVVIFSK